LTTMQTAKTTTSIRIAPASLSSVMAGILPQAVIKSVST
jgi:hypothetical protein